MANHDQDPADILFQKHTVVELRTLQKKMKADVETKKQDLRLMVGERYRDLLEAADSVRKMKESASAIQGIFSTLHDGCEVDKLRRNVRAKVQRGKDMETEERRKALYPVAAQIKLLVDTPEQIWHALESNLYLRASRLWLVASTVIKNLEQKKDMSTLDLKTSFPVVQRQWDSISHLRSKILQKALDHLRSPNPSDQNVTETLCAIMLLEKKTQREAMQCLLDARKASLTRTLKSFAKTSSTVSVLLKELTHLVHWTLRQISAIFKPSTHTTSTLNASSNGAQPIGLLENALRQLNPTKNRDGSTHSTSHSATTITSLYSEKTNVHVIFRYLPSNVQNHAFYFNDTDVNGLVTDSVIRTTMQAWVEMMSKEMKAELFSILQHTDSGKQLEKIRDMMLTLVSDYEHERPRTDSESSNLDRRRSSVRTESSKPTASMTPWKQLCEDLLKSPFSLWEDVFRDVVKRLSVGVLKKSYLSLANHPQTVVKPFLQNLTDSSLPDHDIASFIWSVDKSSTAKPSTSRAFRIQTPLLISIGEAFEKTLKDIKNDLLPFLDVKVLSEKMLNNSIGSVVDTLRSPLGVEFPLRLDTTSPVDVFSIKEDGKAFASLFYDEFLETMQRYKAEMLALLDSIQKPSDKNVESIGDLETNKCLIIGRSSRLVALKIQQLAHLVVPEDPDLLSPTASIAARLKQRQAGRRSLSLREGDGKLVAIQNELLDVYFAAHQVWVRHTCDLFEDALSQGLQSEDWTMDAKFVNVWEAIEINAKSDTGEAQVEKVSLPVHASSFLMKSLLLVSKEMNRVGAYNMEKQLLKQFALDLTTRVLNTYQAFLKETQAVSEKAYLQILFDFDFLTKVMESSWMQEGEEPENVLETRKKRQGLAVSIQNLIRSKIDPIDLAVMKPYHLTNVDRFYARTAVILGALLALNPRPSEQRRGPSSTESPNVIPTVPPSPRFTLLPVTLPTPTPTFPKRPPPPPHPHSSFWSTTPTPSETSLLDSTEDLPSTLGTRTGPNAQRKRPPIRVSVSLLPSASSVPHQKKQQQQQQGEGSTGNLFAGVGLTGTLTSTLTSAVGSLGGGMMSGQGVLSGVMGGWMGAGSGGSGRGTPPPPSVSMAQGQGVGKEGSPLRNGTSPKAGSSPLMMRRLGGPSY
ncbi:Golgi transport complex subunit 1 [Chytridiales sp. JEL 0842]|nr:Golgi transport complex subunit 1 [Chytridiales sp. JEL 0842]